MGSPANTRSESFVGGNLQKGFLSEFARSWLVYHVLIWHGVFTATWWTSPGELDASSLWKRYANFCGQNLPWAIGALLLSMLWFWKVLQLSHRIAGPLERFRDALERMEKGETIEHLTLRRDDLLVEYQYAFNRYLASLESDAKRQAMESSKCDLLDDEKAAVMEELQGISSELRKLKNDYPAQEA